LRTSTGGTLTLLSTADEEPEYEVSAGQTIQVEQTVENHGTMFHTAAVKWYVSENDYLSKDDTLIASSSLDKATNGPFTWTRTVTLPSNLVSGTTYWIGVVIDPDDVIGERNEVNNATYIAAITVQ
jgi:subtilase family serine protease